MAEWTGAIAANADDGYSAGGGLYGGFVVYFGIDGTTENFGGVRFQNVTVAGGSTITSATLTIRANGTVSPTTGFNLQVHADDVDNAAAWSSTSRPDQITDTTAKVDFDPAAWSAGTDYDIDVTSLVSEVIGRAGWSSGNAIRFAIRNDGGTKLGTFQDYSLTTTNCARLTIVYTSGGGSSASAYYAYAQQ